MQNIEGQLDPTNCNMNKALALLAKSFKVNTIPTKQQPKKIINPSALVRQMFVQYDGNKVGQNAVHNPGIQNIENMNGLSVVPEIANQYGNENVVTAPAEGNGNGIMYIRSGVKCRGEGHYACNARKAKEIGMMLISCNSCRLLKRKKRDPNALQVQASLSGTSSDNASSMTQMDQLRHVDRFSSIGFMDIIGNISKDLYQLLFSLELLVSRFMVRDIRSMNPSQKRGHLPWEYPLDRVEVLGGSRFSLRLPNNKCATYRGLESNEPQMILFRYSTVEEGNSFLSNIQKALGKVDLRDSIESKLVSTGKKRGCDST
ncbi:hypothetical protein Tco_0761439 [Tanacetum coccineum]